MCQLRPQTQTACARVAPHRLACASTPLHPTLRTLEWALTPTLISRRRRARQSSLATVAPSTTSPTSQALTSASQPTSVGRQCCVTPLTSCCCSVTRRRASTPRLSASRRALRTLSLVKASCTPQSISQCPRCTSCARALAQSSHTAQTTSALATSPLARRKCCSAAVRPEPTSPTALTGRRALSTRRLEISRSHFRALPRRATSPPLALPPMTSW